MIIFIKNRAISDRIVSYIKNFFELEVYYKPVGVGNFYRNNCIEYESNGDRNKALSIEKYLEEINHT